MPIAEHANLFEHANNYYNRDLYPEFVVNHGNWDIYASPTGACAAIPSEAGVIAGCRASHFGDRAYVAKTLGLPAPVATQKRIERLSTEPGVKFVVMEDITLGFMRDASPTRMGVLACRPGGYKWVNGDISISPDIKPTPDSKVLREATAYDFGFFGVMLPPNFKYEAAVAPTVGKYVVMDELTLGYRQALQPEYMGVLACKIGGHHWTNGPQIMSPGITSLRAATEADFEAFRVKLPFDFAETYEPLVPLVFIPTPVIPAATPLAVAATPDVSESVKPAKRPKP